MDKEEVRRHILKAYKESLGKSYGDIRSYVSHRKRPPYRLSPSEDAAFRQVMWGLTLQGVMTPSGKAVDDLLHEAHLTEYGQKCIAEDRTLPHDINGYLAHLRVSMGLEKDDLLIQYAEDALECFHRDNLRAAVVMLGVAAERSLEILKHAFLQTLDQEKRSKANQQLKKHLLRQRFDYLWKRIEQLGIPDDLQDKLEGDFWGAFQLIRRSRNNAGHFTAVATDKLTALACLAAFPGYVRTVFQLIEYLKTNPESEDLTSEGIETG